MRHCRVLRAVTVLLLAWIALDLAAVDSCALDADCQPVSAQASVSRAGQEGALAHPRAVLHPDHCFCHGLTTGADSTPAVVEPACQGGAVSDVPPGHLLQTAAALDHPPQLPA